MSETKRSHVDALTGMRAYAALCVLAFHVWLNAGHPALRVDLGVMTVDLAAWVKFGWIGVDMFFVLSGFLLTRVAFARLADRESHRHARDGDPLGESYWSFLRRRILRVFPAYYACLTVLLFFGVTGAYQRVPDTLDMFLHLLMSHNVIEKYIVSMNGVFWTLPFEWNFYLLFPLLFVFLRRFSAISLYVSAVGVVLLTKAIVMIADNGYLQLFVLIRLDAFCAGMAAGAISVRYPMNRPAAYAAGFIGIALLLALPFVFANQPGVVHYYDFGGFVKPIWMHLGICLLLCSLTGARTALVVLFDNPVAVWLGLISYSMYLWHLPVIEMLPSIGLGVDMQNPSARGYLRLLAPTMVAVLLVSAASYYVIERPFQRARAAPGVRDHVFSMSNPFWVLGIWAVLLLVLTVVLNVK